jgi:hypothetical protein
MRCYRRYARDHRRVIELPSDSRRNIDLASTPRRVDHCITQRRHQQRIEHRIHRCEHVAISLTSASPVEVAVEVVDAHHCHCTRNVEIHNALVQIVTRIVVRLPACVVVVRHVDVAWS